MVRKCSKCTLEGHISTNSVFHPKVNKCEFIKNTVSELEMLKDVFSNKTAQLGLIKLYSFSQSECTRNGKCGMEIGMSREKDQGAVLKMFMKENINLNIDNSCEEDFIICDKVKISTKHSASKIGSSVKVKWTSADKSVIDSIDTIIKSNIFSNLLITYIDISHKVITIICISSEQVRYVIHLLKNKAFHIPKGNSRGFEYSKQAMNLFMSNIYFQVNIKDVNLHCDTNPIDRRIKLLTE